MTRKILPLAAFLLFAPIGAEATVMRAVDFDEKVESAAMIVVGKVVSQHSRWDDARKNILTFSTFRVEKTLKGQPAQEVTIVTPGGTVGSIAQETIGVPRFRNGEDHLLFVRNSQAGPTVAFLEQGAYRVEKTARGDRMVHPGVTSAVLVDTGRGTAVAPEQPRTLRDFEGKVRETIRRREMLRMEMLRHKQAQSSLWGFVQRNKVLVTLALLGAIIASWQLVKRW